MQLSQDLFFQAQRSAVTDQAIGVVGAKATQFVALIFERQRLYHHYHVIIDIVARQASFGREHSSQIVDNFFGIQMVLA